MAKMNLKGINWIKNLPLYAKTLNEGAKEEVRSKSSARNRMLF